MRLTRACAFATVLLLAPACTSFFAFSEPVFVAEPAENAASREATHVSDGVRYGRGLLWRIESPADDNRGEDEPAGYLFGTMHVSDPRVTTLPWAVRRSLEASFSFHPEIDMNYKSLRKLERSMQLDADQRLESLLGARLFESAAARLARRGIPRERAQRLQPWAVILLLGSRPDSRAQQLAGERGPVLDRLLYQMAQKRGAYIAPLETVDDQVEVYAGLPVPQQVELVRRAVAGEGHVPTEDVIELYVKGDLASLYKAFLHAGRADELTTRVNERLVYARNRNMVLRAVIHLEDPGAAFLAVGALHLPGDHGMLNLLENRGYRLTRLY